MAKSRFSCSFVGAIARFCPCSTFTQAIRFFGHGMGALVSFELVRLLRKQYNTLPVHLFVSAHHAPQIPDLDEPIHSCSR
ncbi:thioesterase II family protein [Fischerella thermalis]|uniref:thioesterase II family protein n=1 Tax=Fischerella thermalis TaxID=372787 RepID=UPI001CA49A7B|nr:thioesterase domain-containing protein [Fischerella thermalis]